MHLSCKYIYAFTRHLQYGYQTRSVFLFCFIWNDVKDLVSTLATLSLLFDDTTKYRPTYCPIHPLRARHSRPFQFSFCPCNISFLGCSTLDAVLQPRWVSPPLLLAKFCTFPRITVGGKSCDYSGANMETMLIMLRLGTLMN